MGIMKYIIFLVGMVLFTALEAQQAGVLISEEEIDDADISEDAILQIESSSKGVLIPRHDEPGKPLNPAQGLMVYVTDEGFYFYKDSKGNWVRLLDASADSPPAVCPLGGIIMYHGPNKFDDYGKGLPGTDMEGWQLCNGENGAPDLMGQFIVGGGKPEDGDNTRPPYNSSVSAAFADVFESTTYESTNNTGGKAKLNMKKKHLPTGHSHALSGEDFSLGSASGIIPHTHDLVVRDHGHDVVMVNRNAERYNQDLTSKREKDSDGVPRELATAEFGVKNTGEAYANMRINRVFKFSFMVPDGDIVPPKIILNYTNENGNNELIDYTGEANVKIDNRPLYYVVAYIIRINDNSEYNTQFEIKY